MIRHIVMFKLKEFQTPAEKASQNARKLMDKTGSLNQIKIDVLKNDPCRF